MTKKKRTSKVAATKESKSEKTEDVKKEEAVKETPKAETKTTSNENPEAKEPKKESSKKSAKKAKKTTAKKEVSLGKGTKAVAFNVKPGSEFQKIEKAIPFSRLSMRKGLPAGHTRESEFLLDNGRVFRVDKGLTAEFKESVTKSFL